LGLRQVTVTFYQFIIYHRKFVLETYRGKVGLHSTIIFKEIAEYEPWIHFYQIAYKNTQYVYYI